MLILLYFAHQPRQLKVSTMSKKVKFTFKFHAKATGLAAVGNSARGADIRLNGKKIGLIFAPNWMTKDNKYSASVAVKGVDPKNPNISWVWKKLDKRFDTIEEMKEWLNSIATELAAGVEFHTFEE